MSVSSGSESSLSKFLSSHPKLHWRLRTVLHSLDLVRYTELAGFVLVTQLIPWWQMGWSILGLVIGAWRSNHQNVALSQEIQGDL